MHKIYHINVKENNHSEGQVHKGQTPSPTLKVPQRRGTMVCSISTARDRQLTDKQWFHPKVIVLQQQ